ncbi:chorismate synthase [Methanolapillus millepedarum]|uniref:Chorismate synthase n=1 Tax=Methanolapillus millepedarum TaxID=3028296 RepID=A0AA97A3W1_9EURY|nr:Chorismate synthase [Methanosarcinaceae archaeon Ac7]
MAGNSFGEAFRITTWGESHGAAIGVVIDGAVPGISLSEEDIQKELNRRKPGQSAVSTARQESDAVSILSGVFEGKTIGTPILLMVPNEDHDSSAYEDIRDTPRPGHADFGYFCKYKIRDHRGGGRSSGRETAGRVAAGAVAKKILSEYGIDLVCHVVQIGTEKADADLLNNLAVGEIKERIERNPVRCADPAAAAIMEKAVLSAAKDGDSLGGIVEGRISGVFAGLGETVFDKLDADLAKAIMSIGAVKGFEVGDGFAAAVATGSQFNDKFMYDGNEVITKTNHCGGILGGISTGMEIRFRAAVKPTPSVACLQETVNLKTGQNTTLAIKGRHDPVIAPRLVPVAEAMAAIVILDHLLRHKMIETKQES